MEKKPRRVGAQGSIPLNAAASRPRGMLGVSIRSDTAWAVVKAGRRVAVNWVWPFVIGYCAGPNPFF